VGRVRRTIQLPTFDPLVGRAEEGITLVWKSIESLGRLGVISGCLDACHGVHIIRHPCGYVSSILKGEEQARFFNRIRASEGYRVFEKLPPFSVSPGAGCCSMNMRCGRPPAERTA